ncbi:DUF262 domain-containing protein [Helicobacter cynogastricus]|uniref:DUF262 domain-containing protein n=1 Tax=Helicobacter cynogastricus TaxID=329937 RepID=UPI000CF18A34|nr:DUF262 domain-containing protein [Helicobacter cynogastricus]
MQVFSFKQFLENYQAIKIPMLQRDYAQGRNSQESTAKGFLEVLFYTLKTGQNLHLDFIYGYQENHSFIPIDGQQRLTTLWLLYFYGYKRANQLDEVRALLKKFTYATRASSKNFCQNLIKKDFDLDGQTPSKAIKSMGGTFGGQDDLNNDPTIKAMLHMLDLIHAQYEKCPNITLEHLERITFNVFDMEEFKLGEELYIKMNARGKQLSPYENLKAFMETKEGIPASLLESIDNKWSDYFFGGDPKNLDSRGLCFLHYANIFFCLDSEMTKGDISEAIDPNKPINEFYAPLQELPHIQTLDHAMDLLVVHSAQDFFNIKASFFHLETEKEKYKSLEYKKICYFFALLALAQHYPKPSQEAFQDYWRVCKHFIENHRLGDPTSLKSFGQLFNFIAPGAQDIYRFLDQHPTHSFHSEIYALEVRKARLILQDRQTKQGWEAILNETSNHKFLCGWVDFLLNFSDTHFDEQTPFSKNSNYNSPNLEKFQKYATLTTQIYSADFLDQHFCLFQRAFLCVGNYSFYYTNYFYGNNPTQHFLDRDALHDLLEGRFNTGLPYFKTFLDRLSGAGDLEKDMHNFWADYTNSNAFLQREWWDQLLIKQKGLFEFVNAKKDIAPRSRRIAFEWHDSVVIRVLLCNGTKLFYSTALDLLGYGFYLYCQEKNAAGLSPYINDNKEKDYPKSTHFKIHNKRVCADSQNKKIHIGKESYPIDLGDVFNSFDRVLKEALGIC